MKPRTTNVIHAIINEFSHGYHKVRADYLHIGGAERAGPALIKGVENDFN